MFKTIFITEFKNNLRSVTFFIFTGIFLVLVHMFASNTDPSIGIIMPVGREWHNAPLVIARLFAFMSVYGILFSIIIVGRSVQKDYKTGIFEFFFTIPLTKTAYLGGRLLGSLLANFLIFSGIIIGLFTGCFVIDHAYYGPFSFTGFLIPAVVILVPNLLLIGAIFFSLATLTRKMITTYVAGVIFMLIYGFMSFGLYFMENDTFRILADPFAIFPLSDLTKYWTVSDINNNLMPLSELLLFNRIIWTTVSCLILYFTWNKFKFVSAIEPKIHKDTIVHRESESEATDVSGSPSIFVLDDSFGFRLIKCFCLAGREFKRLALHPAFLILTALAMINLVINFYGNVGVTSNNLYPLTSWFLEQTELMWIYLIPLIIFLGGVIVWRERDNHSQQLYDTLPVPDWTSYLSKLLALAAIIFFYLLITMFTGIISQIFIFSWTDIDLDLYIKYLFGIDFLNYMHLAVVVLLIQNLVENKYMGFFFCTLYFFLDVLIFIVFKYDNILFRYGHVPAFSYSNINGFGHFAPMIIWYSVYWLFFAFVLGIISSLLWRRNEETHLKYRIKAAVLGMSTFQKISLAFLLFVFFVMGANIYWNKYILNQYVSEKNIHRMQADYENNYSKFKYLSQPQMEHVDLAVDFVPHQRDAFLRGYYVLVNKSDSALDTIIVNLPDLKISKINHLNFSEESDLTFQGAEFGFRMYKLKTPLFPGKKIRLKFDLEAKTFGFTDNNPKNELVRNGSFIGPSESGTNDYLPVIGYNSHYELRKNYNRKKYGLPVRPELPAAENAEKMTDAFFVTYEGIFSTSLPQTIIASGDLVKHWTENGRNYYFYKSDVPVQNQDIVCISGEFEIAAAEHDGIKIEVYYHKKHPWNIQRIMKGAKGALDYCSKNFGRYPYSSMRIVEVPNYFWFGAYSPTSLIVWNEKAGFVSNIKEPDDVDNLYGITAHEIAHDWWPGKILPVRIEGMELLSEAIAQYVWIMCLEKEYGKTMARKRLRREMNDYLSGRNRDTTGERPLAQSYFRYYLTYAKSMIAMYALQDNIGEENVNLALERIINAYKYRDDKRLKPSDLLNAFRENTPDSLLYVIRDFFETITLYENKALSAEYELLENGQYVINLAVSAHKFRADSAGIQREIPLNDNIYIGVLDEKNDELYLKKHKFTQNVKNLEIFVEKKPARAGIDPFLILIDRDRTDNVIKVKKGSN
ncbi:hypothetical protein JW935_09585 [candidate division KSB1 bacterium]|nr:hypothetical protein [candidate division KSB1 bacterium]